MIGASYQKITLKNGLRLLTIPMANLGSVTVLFLVGVGSRYETKKISGISHFLEHMAFKGTKKRPSPFKISSLIEGIGGEFNAFTSKDHTGYYIKAEKKHLPLLLDVLSDMLLNSLFSKEEIEKEKGVIVEEINLREDTPVVRVGEVFERLLYGETPLGWDTVGKKEAIRRITRQDLLGFIAKFYGPGNCVVAVAGGVGHPPIKLVEKYLGSWKKRPSGGFKRVAEKQEKPALSLVYKKTEQAHFCLGFRAYSLFHPNRFALSVLTTILGRGMASRLFIKIREKRGLAYYIRSSTEHYQDVGYFVTQAGVDIKRVEEAIRGVLEEYYNLIQVEPVTAEELERAKEYLKGRLVLGLEDSKEVALLFATPQLLEKRVRTPEEIIKEIDKVTRDDLLRVARDIFHPQKLNLAVIGPFKGRQRFEELLKLEH